MFEQAFKNIDDVLRNEAGCTTELDYTEQSSWLLFVKYLDDLEADKATEPGNSGHTLELADNIWLDPPSTGDENGDALSTTTTDGQLVTLPLYSYADVDYLADVSRGTARRWLTGYESGLERAGQAAQAAASEGPPAVACDVVGGHPTEH